MQLLSLIVGTLALGLAGYAAYTAHKAKLLAQDVDYENYELGRYVIDNIEAGPIEMELVEF